MPEGQVTAHQPRHPGSSRRKGRTVPKGRQVEPAALEEVRALLGNAERRRDLLIEFLHLIQDHYGHLSARHLVALAEEMRLAQAEVYEVATFYAHFDVVQDGETPPPPLTIRVCDSLSCALAGAEKPARRSSRGWARASAWCARPASAAANRAGRRGRPSLRRSCRRRPRSRGRRASTAIIPEIPAYIDLDAYRAAGGYQTAGSACAAASSAATSWSRSSTRPGLRGCGGAGFPTARKWRSVLGEPGPRLMAVNADEGEPGTFKDRYFLETDPHRFLEGMLIAAYARRGARRLLLSPRRISGLPRDPRRARSPRSRRPGCSAGVRVHLRRGAGAYICGEESAMIESIEGKRGLPRHKPAASLPGRPLRPADPDQQCRDAVLGPRHRRARARLVAGPGPQRPQGPAQLFGLRPGARPGRQDRAGRHHRPRADRRVLRRHAARPQLQGLSAGRRLGRHPAGVAGRHPARFRHAGAAWLLHRLGRRRRPLRPGRHHAKPRST